MKHPSQRLRPSPRPFWKRILERYKFRGSLLRPRVPLVLFRIWFPNASRRAPAGLRATVAQYPLTLQLQFLWQQSIKDESRPRALVERSIFTQSVIKELRQAWRDPASTASSPRLSYSTARPPAKAHSNADRISVARQAESRSELALPVETNGPVPARVSPQVNPPLHNVLAQVRREQTTINPETFRLFTEKVFKNRLHTVVAERNILATSSARIGELAYRRQKLSASGAWSSPMKDAPALQPAISPRGSFTRALRKTVDVMPDVSVFAQSQFIHPEQAEGNWQNSVQGARARLFADSAWLNLASQPMSVPSAQPQSKGTSPPRPAAVVQSPQPQLDVGRLSEEVYRHIQRKIRIERERRGI